MKPLATAKGRLGDVLDPRCRALLTLWMLERVLRAAGGCSTVREVAVVGGDASVATLCRARGARWQPDPVHELNGALEAVRRAWGKGGESAMLFLAGDLPWLRSGEVAALVAASAGERLVLGPARRGGTNAILVPPGLAFRFQLGQDSFRRHCAQAVRRGLAWQELRSPDVEHDVDTPEDLAQLERAEPKLWQLVAGMVRFLPVESVPTVGMR